MLYNDRLGRPICHIWSVAVDPFDISNPGVSYSACAWLDLLLELTHHLINRNLSSSGWGDRLRTTGHD